MTPPAVERVTLPGTGLATTRLGFGTAGLMRVAGTRARENLVAAAWDCGIRHFDTAPIYGLGECERILGRVLRARAQDCTVTTKFGLAVNPLTARLLPLQNAGRALLRAVPALRAIARRRAGTLYERPGLTADTLRASLSRSLAALGRERIDCLLAHECEPAQFRDDALFEALATLRQSGRIGCFGIATGREHTLAMLQGLAHYCAVVQFEQRLHEPLPVTLTRGRGCITHGALSGAISHRLRSDATLRRRWEAELDTSLADPGARAALFLRAALADNAEGIVLFQSTDVTHISFNVKAAANPLDKERLRAVQRLAAALATDTTEPRAA